MAIQQTLVLVKPDGVQRGLVGEVIKRFEQRGLKIVGLKLTHADNEFAQRHYTGDIEERHGKHVRDYLVNYITSGPVIALAVQGVNSIDLVRKIIGSTYPGEAEIGTIRGDFAHASKNYVKEKNMGKNIVHASENEEDAKRELSIWFSIDEIHNYKRTDDEHVF